jgi:hypothetical protein
VGSGLEVPDHDASALFLFAERRPGSRPGDADAWTAAPPRAVTRWKPDRTPAVLVSVLLRELERRSSMATAERTGKEALLR